MSTILDGAFAQYPDRDAGWHLFGVNTKVLGRAWRFERARPKTRSSTERQPRHHRLTPLVELDL